MRWALLLVFLGLQWGCGDTAVDVEKCKRLIAENTKTDGAFVFGDQVPVEFAGYYACQVWSTDKGVTVRKNGEDDRYRGMCARDYIVGREEARNGPAGLLKVVSTRSPAGAASAMSAEHTNGMVTVISAVSAPGYYVIALYDAKGTETERWLCIKEPWNP